MLPLGQKTLFDPRKCPALTWELEVGHREQSPSDYSLHIQPKTVQPNPECWGLSFQGPCERTSKIKESQGGTVLCFLLLGVASNRVTVPFLFGVCVCGGGGLEAICSTFPNQAKMA